MRARQVGRLQVRVASSKMDSLRSQPSSTATVVDPGCGEPTLGAFDPHDSDVVAVFAHRGRKSVRRHIRRAIGPIRPTSSRNAASGAKPVTWTS